MEEKHVDIWTFQRESRKYLQGYKRLAMYETRNKISYDIPMYSKILCFIQQTNKSHFVLMEWINQQNEEILYPTISGLI